MPPPPALGGAPRPPRPQRLTIRRCVCGPRVVPFPTRQVGPIRRDRPHGAKGVQEGVRVELPVVHLHPLRSHLGGERLVGRVARHEHRTVEGESCQDAARVVHEAIGEHDQLGSRDELHELRVAEELQLQDDVRQVRDAGAEVIGEFGARRLAADDHADLGRDGDRLGVGVHEPGDALVAAHPAESAEASGQTLRAGLHAVPIAVMPVQDDRLRGSGGKRGRLVQHDAVIGLPVDAAQQPQPRGVVIRQVEVVHRAHHRDPARESVPQGQQSGEGVLADGGHGARPVQLHLGPVPVEHVVSAEQRLAPGEADVLDAVGRGERLIQHRDVRIRGHPRRPEGLHRPQRPPRIRHRRPVLGSSGTSAAPRAGASAR